eukprot:TRINITY_DN44491_c0_g1_i1.p1 TRINITY_DN44491_c0_g1~~TRINITY_DN44491_c0_g1_i1.p1  ORF type:complete len:366 (+),score=66.06 TRINITY_DN44491_c0_g1_i1:75-1100(+)
MANNPEFVWDCIARAEIDVLKALTPDDFSWSFTHPSNKATLLQWAVLHSFVMASGKDMDMISWLLDSGADPLQKADTRCTYTHDIWKLNDKEGTKVTVDCKNLCAITVTAKLRQLMDANLRSKQHRWECYIERLTRYLDLFAEHIAKKKRQRDKISVDASVVEMWESLRVQTSTHDVTFRTDNGTIGAHQIVLSRASPVLAAMLSSSMVEGQSKCIQVETAKKNAVTFFLELLYSGTSCSDIDSSIALSALELSHQWQVDGVTMMLEGALEAMLEDANFDSIAQAAALKDLRRLKSVCVAFASKSRAVQLNLRSRNLPHAVLLLLGKEGPPKSEVKKRRTF